MILSLVSLRSCALHRLWVLQLQLPGLWHRQPLQWICRSAKAQCDLHELVMCWWCTAYPSTARPCVCSGMTEPNYGLYPSREMQMEWLKVYLQAYKLFTKNTEEVSQRELETLYVQVNKFALVRQMLTDAHSISCKLNPAVSWYTSDISFVFSQGFSLLLGFLGSHPSQILLHRFWLPGVSVRVWRG